VGRGITVPLVVVSTLETASLDYTDGDIIDLIERLSPAARYRLDVFLKRVTKIILDVRERHGRVGGKP